MSDQTILVTDAAGFIGFHIAQQLLGDGHHILGGLNNCYDPALKQSRMEIQWDHARFEPKDSADPPSIGELLRSIGLRQWSIWRRGRGCDIRPFIQVPMPTLFLRAFSMFWRDARTMVAGISCMGLFIGIRRQHKDPISVYDKTDHPISLYAATKKANEMMAHSDSRLYRLSVTGLRFFTIMGLEAPDMAIFLFARATTEDRPIKLLNGQMPRDFTYIKRVTRVVSHLVNRIPQDNVDGRAPARRYNVGNHRPEDQPCRGASGEGVGSYGSWGDVADAAWGGNENIRGCQ